MSGRFDSSKTLAGLGSILLTISSAVPIIGVLGIILLLVGLRGLAGHFQEGGILVNGFYGFIFGILAIGLATMMTYSMFFAVIGAMITNPNVIPAESVNILDMILIIAVMFVFFLFEAIFFKRAFDLLAEKTETRMLKTASWILVVGAALTIVIVGLLVLLVAWLVAAIAFLSMKPKKRTFDSPPLAP